MRIVLSCVFLFSCAVSAVEPKCESTLITLTKPKASTRGYVAIAAAVVASSYLSAELTSHLPPHLQFVSQVLATLGIYGSFGAPIMEPLSSWSRKVAFRVRASKSPEASQAKDQLLEMMWFETQKNYSLNAQMSRNVINGFIISVRPNFYEAIAAINRGDDRYAAAQVAEAAVRLNTLFKDIPPDEPHIVRVVQLAFTQHLELNEDFRRQVWELICREDPHCRESQSQSLYEATLAAWLSKSLTAK